MAGFTKELFFRGLDSRVSALCAQWRGKGGVDGALEEITYYARELTRGLPPNVTLKMVFTQEPEAAPSAVADAYGLPPDGISAQVWEEHNSLYDAVEGCGECAEEMYEDVGEQGAAAECVSPAIADCEKQESPWMSLSLNRRDRLWPTMRVKNFAKAMNIKARIYEEAVYKLATYQDTTVDDFLQMNPLDFEESCFLPRGQRAPLSKIDRRDLEIIREGVREKNIEWLQSLVTQENV